MHYRGKDMTFVLTRPDSKEETLLSVPRYNPNWQFTWRYNEMFIPFIGVTVDKEDLRFERLRSR